MTNFEFAAPHRILFGTGTAAQAGSVAAGLGRRALVVTGKSAERSRAAVESLGASGMEWSLFSVPSEPTTEDVRRGVSEAARQGCDLVVGIGGGSPLDAAKAIAILMTNGGDPLDYMEVVGRGQSFVRPSAPCIAIPTTAGTGSEATRNAVIASPEHRLKVSLRGLALLPAVAIVDPELTFSMPPAVTASTGLDALTQIIEPFLSSKASPMTDGLCRDGLSLVGRSLVAAYRDGDNANARTDMSLAALYGGLALANASLGAVHGFAGVIGGMYGGPHGAVCAALLPACLEVNLKAFHARSPESLTLRRYDEIARRLTGDPQASAETGIDWVRQLCQALDIPPLDAYGLKPADFGLIVEKSMAASSMKANPIALTPDEMSGVLAASLH